MNFDPDFRVTERGDREIVLRRTFDAPPALVWRAWTEPLLVQRWMLGPPGWTMPVCEVDLRVGGAFRHVWRKDDGVEMAMTGVHLEIDPPHRIARTQRFEFGCEPGAEEHVGTVTFTAIDGGARTVAETVLVYASRAARDAELRSGMEHGVRACYDRIDELVVTLA
ncbi:MAG: SRPBCC family protein [Planctomycetota bacterium]